MIWYGYFIACSISFFLCRCFRKKRLKNKDIAFYASLNSDLAERAKAKEEISIPFGILSRSCNWAEKNFRCDWKWLQMKLAWRDDSLFWGDLCGFVSFVIWKLVFVGFETGKNMFGLLRLQWKVCWKVLIWKFHVIGSNFWFLRSIFWYFSVF